MSSGIELKQVSKVYGMGDTEVRALSAVNLQIPAGQFVVVLGPSGSGKTTLLNLIGGLDKVSSGKIRVGETNLGQLSEQELTLYRRRKAGFVFQFFNLVPTLTARENVLLAAQLVDKPRVVDDLLKAVGLSARARHFPGQLSGGEQQRVAVARALVKNPEVILADEPTGSLDSETGLQVLDVFRQLTSQEQRTVLLVTHNTALAQVADRVIELKDGTIATDSFNHKPLTVEQLET